MPFMLNALFSYHLSNSHERDFLSNRRPFEPVCDSYLRLFK